MSLAPGDLLGPYEVRFQLGQGGMGVVYLARYPVNYLTGTSTDSHRTSRHTCRNHC